MLASAIPPKFSIPFANNAGGGFIRAIPTASQIGIIAGAASLTDGFPPLNFLPVGSGGVPPFGQDFNGLLNQMTKWNQWQGAGGQSFFDATFAGLIGGYPSGAMLAGTTVGVIFVNTVDNNTSNPNTGGAGWKTLASLLAPYVVDTGAVNALVATFVPAISALSAGLTVEVKIANTNTAAATLNANTLGNIGIKRPGGVPLQSGDLIAGNIGTFVYDGTFWQFNGSVPTVLSGTFRIRDTTDSTKQIAFDASGITPGTTRNLKSPDADGTIALLGNIPLAGYLFGCTLSNNGGVPASKLDIAAGFAADSTGVAVMPVAAMTKDITAPWTVGTNGGSLDTGAIGNNTYHVFAIQRTDTGAEDILTSLSATAPTLPSPYTLFRRIGSFLRAAGSVRAFTQFGSQFLLATANTDLNNANIATAVLQALTVPTGIIVQALIRLTMTAPGAAAGLVLVSPIVEADSTVTQGHCTLANGPGTISAWEGSVQTDTQGRVRFRANVNGFTSNTVSETHGWIDTRGQ